MRELVSEREELLDSVDDFVVDGELSEMERDIVLESVFEKV